MASRACRSAASKSPTSLAASAAPARIATRCGWSTSAGSSASSVAQAQISRRSRHVATLFTATVIRTRASAASRSRAARRLASSERSRRSVVASSGPEHPLVDLGGDRHATGDESPMRILDLASPHEFVEQERPDGEEEPIPAIRRVRHHQRGVDQPVQQVERVTRRRGRCERLDRPQVDAARKWCDRAQQPLFRIVEEPVRRVDGGAEREVPLVLTGFRTGGQVERPVEPLTHRTHRHHGNLASGELDAEWQSVEPVQHLDQVVRFLRNQLVVRSPAASVLDECPDARVPRQRVQVGAVPGYRQRLQPDDVLARHVQGRARRREHVHLRRVSTDGGHQVTAHVDDVLAVVEHQQELLVCQCRRHVGRKDFAGGSQTERGGGSLADPFRPVDRREVDDQHIRAVDGVGRNVERQPGLAHATGAGDGHHRVGAHQAHDLLAVVLAADHGRVRPGDPASGDVGQSLHVASGHELLEIGELQGWGRGRSPRRAVVGTPARRPWPRRYVRRSPGPSRAAAPYAHAVVTQRPRSSHR